MKAKIFSKMTAIIITLAMVFSANGSIVFATEAPVLEKELVSIACFGENGTISISTAPAQVNDGNPEYYVGDEITFTVAPKDGYYLHGVDFSGGYPGQGADGAASYDQINSLFTSSFENEVQILTLTVPKPSTGTALMIYAYFEQIAYDMEVQTFGEGSITVNPEKARVGDTVIFTPAPAAGYELTGLGFVSFTENSDGELMPTAPTAIDTAFTKNDDGNYSYIVTENTVKSLPFGANFTKIPEVTPEVPKVDEVFTENGIKYSVTHLDSPTVSVVGYTSEMLADVELPSTVTYKDTAFTVTAIGANAFQNCSRLTSITIPKGVTTIDYSAFENCTNLKNITIPEGVTAIGDYAFKVCNKLTSITIPESVTTIGYSTFANCTRLTSITIPEGVTAIGTYAFCDCTGLTSITIPKSVTTIGGFAFCGCTGLTSITIPEGVTTIGEGAFSGCTNLTSVSVDTNNEMYCSENGILFDKQKTALIQYPAGKSESTYIVPNGVKSIGGYAFWGCAGLASITIPESVTTIGIYAFWGCTGLTSITIPEGVTAIGIYAFWGCTHLKNITIPESVTTIGNYAFCGCTGLTNITIPEGVTAIGIYAFVSCTGLTSITIPESVTKIGGFAFNGCTGLTSVTINNSNIHVVTNTFKSISNSCVFWGPWETTDRPAFIPQGCKYYKIGTTIPFNGENGDVFTVKIDKGQNEVISGIVAVKIPQTDANYDAIAKAVGADNILLAADISLASGTLTGSANLSFSSAAIKNTAVTIVHISDGKIDAAVKPAEGETAYMVVSRLSPFFILKGAYKFDDNGKLVPVEDSSKQTSNPQTDSSKSPQTGDNSNSLPWVALLFVSGGVLTTLGITKEKPHSDNATQFRRKSK